VTRGADADTSSNWHNLPKWEGPAFASTLAALLGLSLPAARADSLVVWN
jgi:hypothetical protein